MGLREYTGTHSFARSADENSMRGLSSTIATVPIAIRPPASSSSSGFGGPKTGMPVVNYTSVRLVI